MAEPDFDQIAQSLIRDDREFSTPAYIRGEIVQQLRQVWNARGQDVAYQLAPWFQHHSRCARVVKQDTCDCGLNDALKLLKV